MFDQLVFNAVFSGSHFRSQLYPSKTSGDKCTDNLLKHLVSLVKLLLFYIFVI